MTLLNYVKIYQNTATSSGSYYTGFECGTALILIISSDILYFGPLSNGNINVASFYKNTRNFVIFPN